MATTDYSTSHNVKTVHFGIATETAIDHQGDVTTHEFTALDYSGDGEFVVTETYIVNDDLTDHEISETIFR